MRIGIDIDDTVAETQKMLIKEGLKWDKKNLKGRGLKRKDVFWLNDAFYWNVEETEMFFAYVKEKGFFKKLKVKDHANYYINKLYKEGHKIIFITRRDPNGPGCEEYTKWWLDRHRFKYHGLILNAIDKSKICEEEKIDFLIDDSEENIDRLKSTNTKGMLISNGRNESDKRTIFRSWKDIYYFIS